MKCVLKSRWFHSLIRSFTVILNVFVLWSLSCRNMRQMLQQTNNPTDLAWITWYLKHKCFPTSHRVLGNKFCKDSLQNCKCSQCLIPGSHLGWSDVSSCAGAMCSSLSPSQAIERDAEGWQQIRIRGEQETSLSEQSEEVQIFIWKQE